jgi:hypothetical protein
VPHPGQAACGHRVLATIRTDRPARKIRSTDTLARCGSRTSALSRSHDEHDHKNHDHDTSGHAGINPSRKLCQSQYSRAADSLMVLTRCEVSKDAELLVLRHEKPGVVQFGCGPVKPWL